MPLFSVFLQKDVVDIEKVVSFVRSSVLFCREEKSSQCQCQPTATELGVLCIDGNKSAARR